MEGIDLGGGGGGGGGIKLSPEKEEILISGRGVSPLLEANLPALQTELRKP